MAEPYTAFEFVQRFKSKPNQFTTDLERDLKVWGEAQREAGRGLSADAISVMYDRAQNLDYDDFMDWAKQGGAYFNELAPTLGPGVEHGWAGAWVGDTEEVGRVEIRREPSQPLNVFEQIEQGGFPKVEQPSSLVEKLHVMNHTPAPGLDRAQRLMLAEAIDALTAEVAKVRELAEATNTLAFAQGRLMESAEERFAALDESVKNAYWRERHSNDPGAP